MSIPIVDALPLKADEELLFLPSIAYLVDDQTIAVDVNVWVYENENRLGFTALLAHYMGIKRSELSENEYKRLYARTQLFRVDSERNKEITIQFADGTEYTLPKTGKDGRAKGAALINHSLLTANNRIYYHLRDEMQRDNPDGVAYFISNEGITVITDIDDTIKQSNVLDTKALLRNVFLQDYRAIKGMNTYYQRLAQEKVMFHYLSSSPIQLYPLLNQFLLDEGFPQGPMHLREATRWTKMLASTETSMQHKFSVIQALIEQFPQRQFILIGDSGEKDPEIYHSILTQYSSQILAIMIHNVTDEEIVAERYQMLYSVEEQERLTVFKKSDSLPLKF